MFISRYRAATIFAVLPLLLFANTATAVPDNINYQGYLTDAAGGPVNASANIVFRIYSVEIGGTDLWNETDNVTISDGKFTTELGDGTPFPVDLFDGTPLFLGIEIDSDGEMSPRKPLTTTPFAFKAGDADTLQGETATSLDQSAHVADTSNPHNVTATQTGAPTTTAFNNHAGSVNAHHDRYTDSESVSAMGVIDHLNPLHHNRYTSAEAVSAMGALENTNPLNHDRYGDAEAVSALLAADGSGSTLDADLLDGQQASEIIDAASDEVRIPISSLPFVITQPGSYYLTQNLTFTGLTSNAISVLANDVTIDLMGFTLFGAGKTSGFGNDGIDFFQRSNITIMNGAIRNFGGNGIAEGSNSSFGHVVKNVRVITNGGVGIRLGGRSNQVRDCVVLGNGSGMSIQFQSLVASNVVRGNDGLGIFAGEDSVILDNLSLNNGGDGIGAFKAAVIRGNSSGFNDGGGISATGATNYKSVVISGNVVRRNQENGIVATDAAVIKNNAVYQNSGDGIVSALSGNIFDNSVHDNGGRGIVASSGARIVDNTVQLNEGNGIEVVDGTLSKDNGVRTNNVSQTIDQGGIVVRDDNLVKGNKLDNNRINGIFVNSTTGSDNVIEENVVTDCFNAGAGCFGIQFKNGGDFYANNRAAGNFDNYGGSGFGGVIDGGGNFSF